METKVLPFMVNYGRKLRMERDIRKKEKVERATEFVEKIKKVHEKAGTALKKAQDNMKKQADRGRKESKAWKKGDRVLLSTKDLVFKERLTRNLEETYVSPYTIEKVVSTNVVKLRLYYGTLNTNNFLFYFILFFLILLFFFFILFFWKDDEEGTWQGSHMTCHMVWLHKPRRWWKSLEDDVRAHGIHMVALSRIWGRNEDKAWTLG